MLWRRRRSTNEKGVEDHSLRGDRDFCHGRGLHRDDGAARIQRARESILDRGTGRRDCQTACGTRDLQDEKSISGDRRKYPRRRGTFRRSLRNLPRKQRQRRYAFREGTVSEASGYAYGGNTKRSEEHTSELQSRG